MFESIKLVYEILGYDLLKYNINLKDEPPTKQKNLFTLKFNQLRIMKNQVFT